MQLTSASFIDDHHGCGCGLECSMQCTRSLSAWPCRCIVLGSNSLAVYDVFPNPRTWSQPRVVDLVYVCTRYIHTYTIQECNRIRCLALRRSAIIIYPNTEYCTSYVYVIHSSYLTVIGNGI